MYNKKIKNISFAYVFLSLLSIYIFCKIISLGSDVFLINVGYISPVSLQFLEVVISLFLLINYKLYSNRSFFIPIFLWLLLMIIGDLFISDIQIYTSLRETFLWPLIFLFGYTITYKNPRLIKIFIIGITFLMIVSSILFLLISRERSVLHDYSTSVNYIYYVILTLPWLFLIEKDFIRNLLLLLVSFLTFISSKRTAIILVGLCMFFYLYKYIILNKKKKPIKKIALLICMLLISVFIYQTNTSQLKHIESRFELIEDDQGSGRIPIWINVIELIDDSPFYYQLIGHGHNSCIVYMKQRYKLSVSAHNDFLEVLFDYGIFGLILYLGFVLSLVKKLFSIKKQRNMTYFPFLISLLIFFVMSMLSHLIIYSTYFIYLVFFWGMIYSKNTE